MTGNSQQHYKTEIAPRDEGVMMWRHFMQMSSGHDLWFLMTLQ